MVGHETLDLGVEVRILPRQLTYLRKDSKGVSADPMGGKAKDERKRTLSLKHRGGTG